MTDARVVTRSWWRDVARALWKPRIVRRCARCMRVLHDVDGGEDRLKIPRQARREGTVCHGPLNFADPGEPPRLICMAFDLRLG